MERSNLASRLRGRDAGEAKLEFFFRRGVKIDRRNCETTTYIEESFDGSAHPALDVVVEPELSISRRSTLETIAAPENEIPDDAEGFRRLKALYKDCFEARDNFLKVQKRCIERCKRNWDGKLGQVDDLEMPQNATLKTIEETVQKVCMRRNPSLLARNSPADSQLNLTRLEKIFKGFRDRAGDFGRLASLIPSDTFGSVLCGGITTVISAGETYAAFQEDIYKALESVRDVMLCIPSAMEVFTGDDDLHKLTSSMCAAMFDVLSYILDWVTKSKTRRALAAVIRNKTLGQDFKGLLTTMELRLNQAKAQAERLSHKHLMDIVAKAESIDSKIDKLTDSLTKAASDHYESRQLETANLVEKLAQRLEGNQGNSASMLQRLAQMLRSDELQLELSLVAERATAVSSVYDLIYESLDSRPGLGLASRLLHGARRSPRVSLLGQQQILALQDMMHSGISAHDFLEEVGYQPGLIPEDISNVLRTPQLQFSGSAEVHTMLSHVSVQAFVEVEKSRVLFICGADYSPQLVRSPISFATAKLFDGLLCIRDKAPSICVIGYFCGEHRNPGPYSTVEDLIITLVLQLVSQLQEVDEGVLGECLDLIQSRSHDSVELLCQAFEMLVLAMSEEAILFCVLDGISFFETPSQRRADMDVFLRVLLGLARSEADEGAKVKVLLTVPSGCLQFHQLVDPDETLRLNDTLVSRTRVTDHDAMELGLPSSLSYLRDL